MKYDDEFIEKEADAFEEWMGRNDSIYFKRFAFDRGYNPNRLAEFAKQSQKFSGVYERAKAWQEIKLVEGGLKKKFDSGFTKFVLANTCGWTEKSEAKFSGDATSPLAFLLQQADGKSKDLVQNDR